MNLQKWLMVSHYWCPHQAKVFPFWSQKADRRVTAVWSYAAIWNVKISVWTDFPRILPWVMTFHMMTCVMINVQAMGRGSDWRVLVPLCMRVCAQYTCCGLITLHAGYNLLYIFSILYCTYNAVKLIDTWKWLLEFVIFYCQLKPPWSAS